MAMFRTTVINPLIKGKPVFNARRHFTVTSIHDSFPATLYRFQIHRDSRLYDKELKKGNEDLEFADGVEISKDGLVYPGITNICMASSTRVLFIPFVYLLTVGSVKRRGLYAKYPLDAAANTHVIRLLPRRHGRQTAPRCISSLLMHP